ncbi:MAG: substrate-binding domain-containing protein [Bacilli bacterium]|nr:substrate-binding domain-containing protein [Bacilli bacterium]
MKKRSLKIITLVSASFIATSCSIFSNLSYDWMDATNNNEEIHYCLLIGQNEHSDSIERTRWTRDALGTRDATTEINGNANLGTPKEGTLTLGKGTSFEKEFKVTEIEHMEQKSLAGVVWDEITANSTTATWINKHGKNITLLISNNDGMAEGAMHAYNYIQKLPLFGYDANTSTMRLIEQCSKNGVGIMGTVDQNAAAQTSAAYMIIRNILDDQKSGENGIGTRDYNPTNRGFSKEKPNTNLNVYIDGFNTSNPDHEGIVNPNEDERSEHNMDLNFDDGNHEILSKSVAIDINNVNDYLDEKGNVKDAKALAWDDTLGFVHKCVTTPNSAASNLSTYKICHIYNNAAETYLQGTMFNYYSQYAEAFGVENMKEYKYDGDGVSEQTIFDRIKGALSANKFDAFLVNMVTTTDGQTFVSELSKAAADYEGKTIPTGGWDKWEDRLNTPLIFWNKQPQKVTGEVDIDTMNNRYFKYTYFVGVDAAYGGRVQGKMIVDYLDQCYLETVKN